MAINSGIATEEVEVDFGSIDGVQELLEDAGIHTEKSDEITLKYEVSDRIEVISILAENLVEYRVK